VTENNATAERFLQARRQRDRAAITRPPSSRTAAIRMGAEIGISTDRFHARGPVGVEQLTSYKYIVARRGQVRP